MTEQKKKMDKPVISVIRIDENNVIATSSPVPSAPKAMTNETAIMRYR